MTGDAVLVLGMHRSGTSALAGVLHCLGLGMGNALVDSELEFNQKGYWENIDANEFNQQLLNTLGSNWFDVRSIPERFSDPHAELECIELLSQLIEMNFGNQPLWALKDPRLCRVLGFWSKALATKCIRMHCLRILRHPMEVYRSLEKRNGLGQAYSALLWLRYVTDGERLSRQHNRALVFYDDLLESLPETLIKIESDLGLSLNAQDAEAVEKASRFLDSNLRHHEACGRSSCHPLMKLAIECFASLRANPTIDTDSIVVTLEDEVERLSPWISQVVRLMQDQEELRLIRAQRQTLTEEFSKLQLAFQQLSRSYTGVINSASWQYTRGLREIGRLIRRVMSKV